MGLFGDIAKIWGFDSEPNTEQELQVQSEPQSNGEGFFATLFGFGNSQAEVEPEPVQSYDEIVESYRENTSESWFDRQINDACTLLASKDYPIKSKVAKRSMTGAYYWEDTVGLAEDERLGDFGDAAYLASVIVHEDEHNEIYRQTGSHQNSAEEERRCIAKQADFLESIEGNSWRVQHLRNQDGNHFLER